MATENPILCRTFSAGGTITQYQVVKISADNTVVATSATSDIAAGVAQEAGASGGFVSVMLLGVSKVQADAAVNAGVKVGPSADGQVVTATGGTADDVHIIGLMLDSPGEASALGTMLITHGYMIADNS